MKKIHFVLLSSLIAMVSCERDQLATQDSFAIIQDQILTPSCATAGCHASIADGTYAQHKLILTKGMAYGQLVGMKPTHPSALEDGLLRVDAYSAATSLFYHKLIYNLDHHGGKTYGNVMPLGADLLNNGQIEFVRKWIEAGAPEVGSVVDVETLDDETPSDRAFTPLTPPAAGQGFQMNLDKFSVAPNFERELFVRKPLGNTETVYVNRVQIKMRPGSHHFILYDFRNKNTVPGMNTVRDIRNPDGTTNISTLIQMSNHVFMFGGAEASLDDTFPTGMAVEIPAGASFDMNSHYFNKSAKDIPGEVNINLYTIPKSQVKQTVKVLDLGINSAAKLSLPANQRTVITENFIVGKDIALSNPTGTVKVATLFSHTHKLGEKFEILIKGGSRDGQLVYTSTNWEHPTKIKFSTPIELKSGEGLTSRITYNNYTNKKVTFGLTSEDEMGIIFGYYYE